MTLSMLLEGSRKKNVLPEIFALLGRYTA